MLSAPVATPGGEKVSVLPSASFERFGVSRMRDFCVQFLKMDKSGEDLLAKTTTDLLKTEVG